jgi:hypothetical protein
MRFGLVLFLLFSVAGVARADGPFDVDRAAELDDRVARLGAAKVSGIVLAAIGLTSSVASVALAVTDPHLAQGFSDQYTYRPGELAHHEATYITAIFSVIGIAVGVPLWAASSSLEKRARQKRAQLRLAPTGLSGQF